MQPNMARSHKWKDNNLKAKNSSNVADDNHLPRVYRTMDILMSIIIKKTILLNLEKSGYET